jgi:diketogulonate reductase-like aldo/keto reductase
MSMLTRPFGPGGPRVTVVGQGSWRSEASPKEAIAALRRGLDLGLTHIDTAEMYGSGAAEEIIARAVAGRRDEVFLVSKVLPTNASRRGTIGACEKSLARLKTDRLDVYLLHWRGSHPLAETVDAFQALVASGKIRSWGVSNFDVDDLEEIASIAGTGLPACNQVLYHPKERAIEHEILPWCLERGIAVVAYTPFGESPGIFESGSREGRVLHEIAARHRATARQVALAYLLRHPNLFVIPKASSVPHVEENAGAARLELSAADISRIDAAFPLGKPRPLPMI